MSEITNNSFSPIEWLKQFRKASNDKLGFRELRAEIFQQTIHVVNRGEYICENESLKIENKLATQETYFYKKPSPISDTKSVINTRFNVIEADCIETAELLKKRRTERFWHPWRGFFLAAVSGTWRPPPWMQRFRFRSDRLRPAAFLW